MRTPKDFIFGLEAFRRITRNPLTGWGLSQAELGRATGITQKLISAYERGAPIPPHHLRVLAAFFEIPWAQAEWILASKVDRKTLLREALPEESPQADPAAEGVRVG